MMAEQRIDVLRDKFDRLVYDVTVVRNSLSFVLSALPMKQRPAIQATADELSTALNRAALKGGEK